MPKVGVLGALVWDEIHGRDPTAPAVEEWGGIAYALAGFEAALPPDWELVPLIKVGRDLAQPAAALLRSLSHVSRSTRLAEVTAANNRVVLRYETAERRCERMSGGVPPWTWDELGPMVRDLDALYVNFISGFELNAGTGLALRHGFGGPIYADLHSLMLGMGPDGVRSLRPLPDAPSWFGCFDLVQMNEEEMQQLAEDPLQAAGEALGAGVSALLVTLGRRGAVYVAAPGFERLGNRADRAGRAGRGDGGGAGGGGHGADGSRGGRIVRTALVEAPAVDVLDPTGCGDVFGATAFSALLAGRSLEAAVAEAVRAAARNAAFRGATGLAAHLRGSLVAP